MPNDDAYINDDAFKLRNQLVDGLKSEGMIQSPGVEAAFREVPRHLFVPGVPITEAYTDQSIPTKFQDGKPVSSSSQPAIMAIMLEQLGLEAGQRVLEIGAGTGYNAALMAHMVGEHGEVITIDLDEDIVEAARAHLSAAGYKQVRVICLDGGYGYPQSAPYDRIILTVGATDITPAWSEQLKPDGRLVLPLAIQGHSQKSVAFEATGEHLQSLSVQDCGFMGLRGAFADQTLQAVPVGPLPNLFLEAHKTHLPDPEKIYIWLTGEERIDRNTGVEVNIHEVFGSLPLWLALHEPGLIILSVTGETVDQNVVPPLIGFGGRIKTMSTLLLSGEGGMAALMRPLEQPDALQDPNDWKTARTYALVVRQFGPGEGPAQCLIQHVLDWQAAGRPSSKSLRIRAYPIQADYHPQAGEYVVEKTWTTLVLDWPSQT